jgi:hypothetical protein
MRPARELEVYTWEVNPWEKREKKAKLNCRGDTDSEITVETGFVCSQTATTDVSSAEICETFCIIHRGTGLLVDIWSTDLV